MSEERKSDHIEMAFASQVDQKLNNLNYEPMFGNHKSQDLSLKFLNQTLKAPLWVSSMTGGTEKAKDINTRLAVACGKFGLGMGLGSCRPLLESDERLADFQVRKYMGEYPLYVNLGIAQVEQLIKSSKTSLITELIKKLEADGLIIHINPLQEALQPEGDQFEQSPAKTLELFFNKVDIPVVIKEVGQGFGPKSLKLLLEMPIKGIELAGFGGTNFTFLEHSRHSKSESGTRDPMLDFAYIGHTAQEMIENLNFMVYSNKLYKEKDIIISGGLRSVLDGYALKNKCELNSVLGFASVYLKQALIGQQAVDEYIEKQIKAISLANNFLQG